MATAPTNVAKQDALEAILWFALAKMAGKEGRRDLLAPGGPHDVKFKIAAQIDRANVSAGGTAVLSVGHDTVRTSSSGPPLPHLVAVLLGEMPKTRRARLLRTLPDEVASQGALPAVTTEALEAAEKFCQRLRAKTEETARGPVSVRYELVRSNPAR